MRSTHFAVHYLPESPVKRQFINLENNSGLSPEILNSVNLFPDAVWFGFVIPKRYAKKAVTRNLIKRLIRQFFKLNFQISGNPLSVKNGLWVIRLKTSFDKNNYLSAGSKFLNISILSELKKLFSMQLNSVK
jgi:ribonuclease P protein component